MTFPRVRPLIKEIFCARDKATALEMAGSYLASKYKSYASWGQDAVMPSGETFQQPFESLLRDRFVLGSPEECFAQLRPCWEELGTNFLFFRTHWIGMPLAHALASMRLISDESLPSRLAASISARRARACSMRLAAASIVAGVKFVDEVSSIICCSSLASSSTSRSTSSPAPRSAR